MTKIVLMLICLTGIATGAFGQETAFETTEIVPGVYQFRYQSHNGFFVVSDDGVVAIDPISTDAAEQYANEIRRFAPDATLRAVVYSHDHADHATGAEVLRGAFQSKVPVIAHQNAVAPLRAAADPDLPAPTITFSDVLTLRFGGRTLELHHLGKNHSDNSLVAFLPDERVAFAVDFVAHDRVGYRDLPGFVFPDQFESLVRLAALDFDRIVFGHGPAGDKASVERQVGYYRALEKAVEAAHAAGMTEDQAADEVRLPAYADWGGYEDWFPLNVRGMYRWIDTR